MIDEEVEQAGDGESAEPEESTAGMLGVVDVFRSTPRYLRPYVRTVILTVVTLLPNVAFYMFQPLVMAKLVDDAIIPGDWAEATRLLLILAGLLVAYIFGEVVNQFVIAKLAAQVGNDLRAALFEHLQRLSLGFYSRSQLGDILSRFTSSLEAYERALASEIPWALSYILTLVVGAGILITIEWRLALVCLVLLPTTLLGPRWFGTRAERASYVKQTDGARLISVLQENLAGQIVVKAFGLQKLQAHRFHADLDQLLRSSVRVGFLNSVLSATMNAGAHILLVLVIALGAVLALLGLMSVGSVVAFSEILWWMSSSVEGLANLVAPLQQAATGLQRVREILDEQPGVADAPGALLLPPINGNLAFREVSFSYTDAEPNLRDVSFDIPQGSSVAFIGPSGCGKSTVLNLLMRFYDPSRGSVRFDGTDARSVTQDSLRAQMGVVFQESFLFNTTVRENIRLGKPDATDADVEAAARAAEIHDVIQTMPLGYDTIVGERGGRLSGGQRQRVAIARAIVRNPPILLLDEATSALDVATEAAINETLARLAKGRTVVSVTHRLATASGFDRLFVLDAGEIVESGSHADLLARGGAYARLWQKQSAVRVSTDGQQAAIDPAQLRVVPILASLNDEMLAELAQRLVTETIPAGRDVIREGDAGDRFYIIARGSVEVVGGSGHRLAVLQDGDFFGEVALLENVPRTATVRTLTPSTFLTLQRGQLLELVATSPELAETLDAQRRLRGAVKRDA